MNTTNLSQVTGAMNELIIFVQRNILTPLVILTILITMIALIVQITKIGANPNHPMLREIAMRDIASNIVTFALIPVIPFIGSLMTWSQITPKDIEAAQANPMLAFFRSLGIFSRIIVIVHAIAILTSFLFFIRNVVQLAMSGSNVNARTKAITGLMWTGLSVSLLGGLAVIFPILYSL